MKLIDYTPNSLSHNPINIDYWTTQGIVIDDERYAVEELFVRSNVLYGVITKDKKDFYEYPLATNVTQNNFDASDILNRLKRLEDLPQYRYDDTGVLQRLNALEESDKTNLGDIKQRLVNLENKPDNDKQTLTYSDGNLSITNGNTIRVPMSVGKSAYQSWLDLGNKGTEQDFIKSLKGAKGDKGDVTDIGTNALVKFLAVITNPNVPTTNGNTEYRSLSYNTKTQIGILHLDIRPTENTGVGDIIGKVSNDSPKPYTLIELNVVGNNEDGTGQIYATTDGVIRCNKLIKGRRYVCDIIGYFKY